MNATKIVANIVSALRNADQESRGCPWFAWLCNAGCPAALATCRIEARIEIRPGITWVIAASPGDGSGSALLPFRGTAAGQGSWPLPAEFEGTAAGLQRPPA
jgi:hypothetical protein